MNDHPLYREAIEGSQRWLELSRESAELEPTAMSLATCDASGAPDARTVLLKQLDDRGFVFYTNLDSVKGRQIAENPHVALCFLWKSLERQLRVRGRAELVDESEADAYFASRPRGSQLGAWASDQSRTLGEPALLPAAVARVESRFADQPVPRPMHWSGLRVVPHAIEFWTGKAHRLHERRCYEYGAGIWHKRLLQP